MTKTKLDVICAVIWGITLVLSLFLILNIVFELNYHNSFKPDIQVKYWYEYNSIECELNTGANLIRKDFYDFCPYMIRMMRNMNRSEE